MIPARPTTYNGIEMRSRLEARFAAKLDRSAAGLVESRRFAASWHSVDVSEVPEERLEWMYEPRAFANPDGQYLPDFKLTWYRYDPPSEFDIRVEYPEWWHLVPRERWQLVVTSTYIEVKPTRAYALASAPRMEIIWSSEPRALLQVAFPCDHLPECDGGFDYFTNGLRNDGFRIYEPWGKPRQEYLFAPES